MKIRTDFVTNSSSSSFVIYTIKPGENKKAFKELCSFMEKLCEKYEQRYILDTYGGPDEIDIDIYNNKIQLQMWTPGLSDEYIDQFFEDKEEEQRREKEFSEFGRDNYPPNVEVAISALFGYEGDSMMYLCNLDCETELLDDNGKISSEIVTDLTHDECVKLVELLEEVEVEEEEILGGTD